MAPAIANARRKVVRRTANLRRQASPTQPLPWTIADEDDFQQPDRSPKRQRRQAAAPKPPGPEPSGPRPSDAAPKPSAGPGDAAPDAGKVEDPGSSSESTDNDQFPSESSQSEDEDDHNLEDHDHGTPTASIGPSSSQTTSISPTDEIPLEDINGSPTTSSSSRAVTRFPSSSTSTTTNSIVFSTLTRSDDAVARSSNAEPTSSNVIRIHEHPHGLSGDAIHGLIAFGAIGGFMGFLAVAWFFWRRAKKRNRPLRITEKPRTFDEPKPARHVQLLAKIPFLKSRFASRSWVNIDDPSFDDDGSRENVYQEKSWTQTATVAPRLDSQFFSPNQVMGIAVRIQGGDHAPNVSGHQANHSISSSLHPERSQSQRSHIQPLRANPLRPLSEISSLSSGFGDGTLPPPNGESTLERNMPQAPASTYGGSRRDTVYTEASEDLPPRHRNVNSWVKQQTSRVKRSQARTSDEAPPVPQMPVEEDFRLMLPDGEVPRKVEDSGSGVFGVAK